MLKLVKIYSILYERTPEPNKNIIISIIPFSVYNSSSSAFQQPPPSGHYLFFHSASLNKTLKPPPCTTYRTILERVVHAVSVGEMVCVKEAFYPAPDRQIYYPSVPRSPDTAMDSLRSHFSRISSVVNSPGINSTCENPAAGPASGPRCNYVAGSLRY